MLFLIPHMANFTVATRPFHEYEMPVVRAVPESTATNPVAHEVTEEYQQQLRNNAIRFNPPDTERAFAQTFVYLMLRAQDAPSVFKKRSPVARFAVSELYEELMARLFVQCLRRVIGAPRREIVFDAIVHREHSLSPLTVEMTNNTIYDMLQRSIQISPNHSVLMERAKHGAMFGELLIGSSVEVIDFLTAINLFITTRLLNRQNSACFREETSALQERADAQIRNILSAISPLLWVRPANRNALLTQWCFLLVLTNKVMAPLWPFLPLSLTTYRQLANALLHCVCGVADTPMITGDVALLVSQHVTDFLQYAEQVGTVADIDTKILNLEASIAAIAPSIGQKLLRVQLMSTQAPLPDPRGEWNHVIYSCIVKMIHGSFQIYTETFKGFLNIVGIIRDNLATSPRLAIAISDAAIPSIHYKADMLARPAISEVEFIARALTAAAGELPLIVDGVDNGCLSLYADISGLRYSYMIPGNACETQQKDAWNSACNFARNRVALIVTGNV
jgi:hypothetical protein